MKTVYLAAVASNLAMMSYGLFFGWPSPSLPPLLEPGSHVHLTTEEVTWVTSLQTIGAAVGVVFSASIINVIGRKWTMLLTAVPGVISWLMIAFATTAWELFVARFFCGLSSGNGFVSAMMYTGEISPANIRGTLTCMLLVSAKIGMALEWTIGPFLSMRDLALVSLSMPILFVLCMVWLPESPYHLMRRGRHQQAIKVLAQLRGTTDVSEEAGAIEKSVKIDLANDTGLWELVSVSGNRRALIVVLGLFIGQQWSGSMAILSYAELIFNATGNDFEGKYVTMIMGAVQVACTVCSTSVVDRYGRRVLLMTSMVGTTLSTTLVGLFFYLKSISVDVSGIVWLPATGTILYIVTYALGLAGLPFTMMSELFPTNVKALGSTIGIMCSNFAAFTVTMSYYRIAAYNGEHTAFWVFAAVSLSGIVFVYFYVPETKGKTLQEVQHQLHGEKVSNSSKLPR